MNLKQKEKKRVFLLLLLYSISREKKNGAKEGLSHWIAIKLLVLVYISLSVVVSISRRASSLLCLSLRLSGCLAVDQHTM